jgi:hypothetical protein
MFQKGKVSLFKRLLYAFSNIFGNIQVRIDENVGLICSFCGKGQSEVKKVIAGPEVYICDECVVKAYDECEKNWWDLFWISMRNKNISEKNRRALLKRAMHIVNKKGCAKDHAPHTRNVNDFFS